MFAKVTDMVQLLKIILTQTSVWAVNLKKSLKVKKMTTKYRGLEIF